MIKPKYNFLITGFFDQYIRWLINKNFHEIKFNKPHFNGGKSVLLIANHFSWWDGFLLYHINKAIFKKKFHIMVLEESMQKMGFLKYLGAFSVAKNSRQVLESLNYAATILNDPENMVVIFPQGKLYSNFVADIHFERGVTYIAARAKSNFQYVFAATFIENFQYKKTSAHVYVDVLNADIVPANNIADMYQKHYQTARQQQTNITV